MNAITTTLCSITLWATFSATSNAAPQPTLVDIGGVSMNHYCVQTYGNQFKSVLVGKTAGDWACEQSANNRRPISVEHACKLHYGRGGLKAKALNWNDPLSWRCFEERKVVVRDHRTRPVVRDHRK